MLPAFFLHLYNVLSYFCQQGPPLGAYHNFLGIFLKISVLCLYVVFLLDFAFPHWQVTYVNGLAKLTGPHEVTYERRGKETVVTAERYAGIPHTSGR